MRALWILLFIFGFILVLFQARIFMLNAGDACMRVGPLLHEVMCGPAEQS